jgi:prepilin-type N-terminal cleavage/methylation domain-containing protein
MKITTVPFPRIARKALFPGRTTFLVVRPGLHCEVPRSPAFTLIELLAVVAIIGVLAGIFIPTVSILKDITPNGPGKATRYRGGMVLENITLLVKQDTRHLSSNGSVIDAEIRPVQDPASNNILDHIRLQTRGGNGKLSLDIRLEDLTIEPVASPSPHANIHSARRITNPVTLASLSPDSKYRSTLSAWSPGKPKVTLYQTAPPYVELNSSSGPIVAVLRAIPSGTPICDAIIDFTYRIPSECNAKELRINVKTESGNTSTMRLPVQKDQWVHETIPVSDIIGGEIWRLRQGPRTLRAAEVALFANTGPASLHLQAFALQRHPSPWGAHVTPQAIVTNFPIQRTFIVQPSGESAWLQVQPSHPVTVTLNGHDLGPALKQNFDTRKWPDIGIQTAKEYDITPYLKEGINTLSIAPIDGKTANILAALGWQNADTRNIIVTDDAWTLPNGIPVTSTPYYAKGMPRDIYPLRNPQAWSSPLPQKRAGIVLSPTLPPIPVAGNSAARAWTTARDQTGHWHFVTPQGNPLYFMGTQLLGIHPQLNYRYYRSMMERYETQADYVNDTLNLVRELGFNGLAPSSTSDYFKRAATPAGLYNFGFVNPAAGGPFMKNREGKLLTRIADPFDEGWRKRYRIQAKAFGDQWRDDASFVGVFVNNEMQLDGSVAGSRVTGFIYSKACHDVFVQWLTERYNGDLDKLKKAWKDECPSIDTATDFAGATKQNLKTADYGKEVIEYEGHAAPPREFKLNKDHMEKDLYDFAVHAMTVYANFILETLRKELPGKIIGSNRMTGNASDEMLAAWKNYDVIAWNAYPFTRWQSSTFNAEQLHNMKRAHKITGKPVILTEFGTQALDARLPNRHTTLYTQKQRGEEYHKLLRQFRDELPFLAGFVLFGWQNLADTERQAWGIIDDRGMPYADYAQGIKNANRLISEEILNPRSVISPLPLP